MRSSHRPTPDPASARAPAAAPIGRALAALSLLFTQIGCQRPAPPPPPASRGLSIVGGVVNNSGSPFVGFLVKGVNAASFDPTPLCTATAIARNAVLTAAHCVVASETDDEVCSPKKYGFGVGLPGAGTHIYPATRVVRHPDYDLQGVTGAYDLAVLVLEEELPVTLPLASLAAAPPTLGNYTALGYGQVVFGPKGTAGPQERRSATVRVTASTAHNVLTAGVTGAACFGDSGGPLLGGSNGDQIFGVTSLLIPRICNVNAEVIYADVANEASFIRAAMGPTPQNCKDFCGRFLGAQKTQCLSDANRGVGLCFECQGDHARLCQTATGPTCCAEPYACSGPPGARACAATGGSGTPGVECVADVDCACGKSCCNGTCVDLATNSSNCGACGTSCAVGDSCGGGLCFCKDTKCATICVDTDKDPLNCGACNNACAANSLCCDGSCCPLNARVCCGKRGSPNTCIDPLTDAKNCGGCGIDCGTGGTCSNGTCSCAPGYALCGGVCVDTASSVTNCGACGNACAAGQVCSGGSCTGCPFGQTACNGTCVDLNSSTANCGACGVSCGKGGAVCQSGSCACTSFSQTLCNGACVDVSSDPANCGACGSACTGSQNCVSGSCADCPTGQQACHGACVDLQSDPANCGGCDLACRNAGETCQGGACRCPDGRPACNGVCLPAGAQCCGSSSCSGASECLHCDGADTCVAPGTKECLSCNGGQTVVDVGIKQCLSCNGGQTIVDVGTKECLSCNGAESLVDVGTKQCLSCNGAASLVDRNIGCCLDTLYDKNTNDCQPNCGQTSGGVVPLGATAGYQCLDCAAGAPYDPFWSFPAEWIRSGSRKCCGIKSCPGNWVCVNPLGNWCLAPQVAARYYACGKSICPNGTSCLICGDTKYCLDPAAPYECPP